MPNITNYSPLIQSMFGRKGASWRAGATLPGVFQFSQLNSSSIQSPLKAAGIYTSSTRYKTVIPQVDKRRRKGERFYNMQGVTNIMTHFTFRGGCVVFNGLIGLNV